MYNLARKWAGIVGACFSLSLMPSAHAVNFPDVSQADWFAEFVQFLSNQNIVSGYPNHEFRPTREVTRAEFATMLAKAKGLPVGSGTETRFSDVPASHWASGAISMASSAGWLSGYPNGTFGPNRRITNAEMYTIVSKLIPDSKPHDIQHILNEFEDGVAVPPWAKEPVARAAAEGIYVSEITPKQLDPFMQATRAQVSAVLAKLINESFRTPIATTNGVTEPIVSEPRVPPRIVAARGTLERGQAGRWFIREQQSDRRLVLQNVEDFADEPWFAPGATVRVEGRVRPGSPDRLNDRSVIYVSEMRPVRDHDEQNNVTISGVLQRTVEAGGWVVNDRRSNQKYLLLGFEEFRDEPWFAEGTRVRVQGRPQPGTPSIYMEGTPFAVDDMRVMQRSLTNTGFDLPE